MHYPAAYEESKSMHVKWADTFVAWAGIPAVEDEIDKLRADAMALRGRYDDGTSSCLEFKADQLAAALKRAKS